MPMNIYKPSNQVSMTGIALLLASIFLGGLAIGYLVHLISKLLYLVFLFPVGAGFVASFILAKAINLGKVRFPVLACICGLLFGFFAYGVYQYADYQAFTKDVYQALTANRQVNQLFKPTLTPQQVTDFILKQKTGSTGFPGYIRYIAQQGITISRARSSHTSFTIKEPFSWLYFLVELLLYGIIPAIVGYSTAGEPFCEHCNHWYTKEKHLGSVPISKRATLIAAVENGQYQQLSQLLQTTELEHPRIDVQLKQCEHCESNEAILSISATKYNNDHNIESEDIMKGIIIDKNDLNQILPA